MKDKLKVYAGIALVSCFIWLAISNAIQAFKCPQLTNTELMFRIPKIFIADYKSCESR